MIHAENPGIEETAWSIRGYRSGDEQELVAVLDTVFDGWPSFDLSCTSTGYWRWRYIDNPGKSTLIVVCLAEDVIVGCVHYTTVNMKIGDKIWSGCLGGDIQALQQQPVAGRAVMTQLSGACVLVVLCGSASDLISSGSKTSTCTWKDNNMENVGSSPASSGR